MRISQGNQKLGGILNISLPPLQTCVPNPPCASLCYARKAYEGYSQTTAKPMWDENLRDYRADVGKYFTDIRNYLQRAKKHQKFFRWHASGDIVDAEYFYGMVWVAQQLNDWQFMGYTRTKYAHQLANKMYVFNFNLLQSVWLTETETPKEAPWFKVVPKGTEILKDACPGSCQSCKACWNLKAGEGRIIHQH